MGGEVHRLRVALAYQAEGQGAPTRCAGNDIIIHGGAERSALPRSELHTPPAPSFISRETGSKQAYDSLPRLGCPEVCTASGRESVSALIHPVKKHYCHEPPRCTFIGLPRRLETA